MALLLLQSCVSKGTHSNSHCRSVGYDATGGEYILLAFKVRDGASSENGLIGLRLLLNAVLISVLPCDLGDCVHCCC